MNEFEKRINALRLQFKAEREMIVKDSNRAIGHINNAIGMVKSPEAREALRAEKGRLYEAMRTSLKYNRLCYRQQLELLEDEHLQHRQKNPSKRQLRRMMAHLAASADGQNPLTITFGENRRAIVTFN